MIFERISTMCFYTSTYVWLRFIAISIWNSVELSLNTRDVMFVLSVEKLKPSLKLNRHKTKAKISWQGLNYSPRW